jgi:hypothetical protein
VKGIPARTQGAPRYVISFSPSLVGLNLSDVEIFTSELCSEFVFFP